MQSTSLICLARVLAQLQLGYRRRQLTMLLLAPRLGCPLVKLLTQLQR